MYNGQTSSCPKQSLKHKGHSLYRTQTLMDSMDTQKDMIHTNIKHTEMMSDTSPKTPVVYKNLNEFSLHCLKRTERLSAALYMVTGLIPDVEPLKWRLREQSLVLLSDVSVVRETLTANRMSLTDRTRDTVSEIITLLNVAYAGDLLSEMNVAVLKKEYLALKDMLEEGRTLTTNTERIMNDIFADEYARPGSVETSRVDETARHKTGRLKGHLKDNQYEMSDRKMSVTDNVRYEEARPIVSFTKDSPAQSEKNTHITSHVYTATEKEHQTTRPIWEIKKERRDQIIAVIKRKKYVSIKDITLFVRNISEKTIQREIVAMVEEGVLKKEGNKRWSTYSLVQK